MRPFIAAGPDDGETEVLQAIGMWLPGGPEDYAIPDLAVVDADSDEHLRENNCYDPAVFRLVLEVTWPSTSPSWSGWAGPAPEAVSAPAAGPFPPCRDQEP